MEHIEKLLIMDCPSLGNIMSLVDTYRDFDNPSANFISERTLRGFEELLGVYLNFYDYREELDDLIDYIEQLDLFETMKRIIFMIESKSTEAWSGFVDIKIFTHHGLIGLIFLIPE